MNKIAREQCKIDSCCVSFVSVMCVCVCVCVCVCLCVRACARAFENECDDDIVYNDPWARCWWRDGNGAKKI